MGRGHNADFNAESSGFQGAWVGNMEMRRWRCSRRCVEDKRCKELMSSASQGKGSGRAWPITPPCPRHWRRRRGGASADDALLAIKGAAAHLCEDRTRTTGRGEGRRQNTCHANSSQYWRDGLASIFCFCKVSGGINGRVSTSIAITLGAKNKAYPKYPPPKIPTIKLVLNLSCN